MRISAGIILGLLALALLSLSACGTTQRLALPVAEIVLDDAVLRLPAEKGDRFVVLTIDDAPSSRTEEILDILDRHSVKATFFVHTDQMSDASRRDAITRLAQSGHDIAHHMPADRAYGQDSQESFDAAFRASHTILKTYGEAFRPYFRPPQGSYRDRLMDPSLEALGYDRPLRALGSDRRYVLASFIPWDAARGQTDTADADRNAARSARYTDQLLGAMFPGAIVLFHDGEEDGRAPRVAATLVSLDRFLTEAKAKGYEVVSLSAGIERAVKD